MPAIAYSRASTIAVAKIIDERDIVRVAPCRAIWRCDCGYTNRLFFTQTLHLGSVYGRRMSCGACHSTYKGMVVTDPFGRR